MAGYRFDRFHFDPTRLTLRASGQPITLRPKTASLLAVLLRQPGQLVPKGELIEQVWQRRQVQDQSLFQAISELRAALRPLDAIRTHPNLGYEWVLPLRPHVAPPLARVAGIAALVALNGLVLFTLLPRPESAALAPARSQPESTPMLPALQAFSLGMTQLQQAHYASAIEYFALAAREHPQFLEAHLMAAETSLAAGEVAAARAQASALLAQAESLHNLYLKTAALDVLSRADLAQGQSRTALGWARAAAGSARQEGFACTALAMEDRVLSIANSLADDGEALASPQASTLPVLADTQAPAPAPTPTPNAAASQAETPPHCASITPRTSHHWHGDIPCDDSRERLARHLVVHRRTHA